jgi:dTDP-4-dehydrorhamnose reductase
MVRTPSILVAGRRGRLARALIEEAKRTGFSVRALGRPELDIVDPDSVRRAVAALSPSAIVNAAGNVVLDDAERQPERAFAVNRDGAANLAEAAARAGIPFLQVSSDYVFDGNKTTPYVEDDLTGPLNIYGQSKVAGEEAVLAVYPSAVIVRTSWIFGIHGTNFVTTMLRLAETQEVVRVVADQYGTPTADVDLAQGLLDITAQLLKGNTTQTGGIYHLANSGDSTWLGLAQAVFSGWASRGRRVPRVEAISLTDWPGPAKRPRYSPLDCGKVVRTFGIRLPPWQQSLEACLEQLAQADAQRR